METRQNPDDIQGQMAAVRWSLARDVQGIRTDVQTLVDWRYHFRRHPAGYCAGAAVLGFLIAPGPRSAKVVVSHQIESIAATVPNGASPNAGSTRAAISVKSVALTILGMAASAAARQAIEIARHHGNEFLQTYLAARGAGKAADVTQEKT